MAMSTYNFCRGPDFGTSTQNGGSEGLETPIPTVIMPVSGPHRQLHSHARIHTQIFVFTHNSENIIQRVLTNTQYLNLEK